MTATTVFWLVTELVATAPQDGGRGPAEIPVADAHTTRSLGRYETPFVFRVLALVKLAEGVTVVGVVTRDTA